MEVVELLPEDYEIKLGVNTYNSFRSVVVVPYIQTSTIRKLGIMNGSGGDCDDRPDSGMLYPRG